MGFTDFHLHAVTVPGTSRFWSRNNMGPSDHMNSLHSLPATQSAMPVLKHPNSRCLKSLHDISAGPTLPSPFPLEDGTCVVRQEDNQSHQLKPQSLRRNRDSAYVVLLASAVFGKPPLRKNSHLPNEGPVPRICYICTLIATLAAVRFSHSILPRIPASESPGPALACLVPPRDHHFIARAHSCHPMADQ